MATEIFIEEKEIRWILAFKSYTSNKAEQQEVKDVLLEPIKEDNGDKWDRLKEGSRKAFDEICFLAAKRGFMYAGNEYLTKVTGMSEKTIRRRLDEIVELGHAVKRHRRAKNCNGKGKPVYFFVHHPYFKYWVKKFDLDVHTDVQTENAEISTETRESDDKKRSNNVLTNISTSYSLKSGNIIHNSYTIFDDKRTPSQPNEKAIKRIVKEFREQMKDVLNKRSFDSVVRKVKDKLSQGKVYSFRDYLATALVNKAEVLELRRMKDKAKAAIKLDKQRRAREKVQQSVKQELPFYDWLNQRSEDYAMELPY